MYVEYYEFFYKPTTITHQQITLLDENCQLQCTHSPRPVVHWHRLDPDTEYIYCWNSSLEMVLGDLSHSFAYHPWWVFILGGCIQFEERTKSHDDLNLEWYMIWQRIIVFDENNYKIIFPLSNILSLWLTSWSLRILVLEGLGEIMLGIPKQLHAEWYLDHLNSVLNLKYQYHIFRDY